ncbi:hypothetical protein N658DRAFT_352739 [Parathielavia hyrcaniae]|uniref:Altered inheritance of mitochondria protein 11 n=1 Tax=Parathielavia hyrcaniae TaxID=113614 RepID=A0AAN6T1Y4_9PEZI|nr:hypothetical protein N658DRAFT_352739 [Parathielavia hyrcaniae]
MVVLSWLFGYSSPLNGGVNKPPSTTAATSSPSPLRFPTAPPPPASASASAPSPVSPQQELPTPTRPDLASHFFSHRSLRQLGLFLGGAGFFYWSLRLSRRAITRHQLAAQLKFYQPSHQSAWGSSSRSVALSAAEATQQALPKRDPLVAVEALNLATLNTLTFAVAAVGGVAWAFDISTLEELRRITRRSIVEAGGEADEEAEREVVEWVAKTFGIEERKGGEEREGEGDEGKRGSL